VVQVMSNNFLRISNQSTSGLVWRVLRGQSSHVTPSSKFLMSYIIAFFFDMSVASWQMALFRLLLQSAVVS